MPHIHFLLPMFHIEKTSDLHAAPPLWTEHKKKARRLYAVAPLRIDNIMHCSDLSYNTELCSVYELNDVAYLFSIRYLFFHLDNGVEH